jgi:hypothetical protein
MFSAIIKHLARPVTDPVKEVLAKVDEAIERVTSRSAACEQRLDELDKKVERLAQWVDTTQFQLQRQGLPCGIYCPKCGHVSRSQDMRERVRVGDGDMHEWCCQSCEHVIRVGDAVTQSSEHVIRMGDAVPGTPVPDDLVLGDTEPEAAAPRASTEVIYDIVNDGPVGSYIATAEVARRLDLPGTTVALGLERLQEDGLVCEVGTGVWKRVK